jgi:hypothetical protein
MPKHNPPVSLFDYVAWKPEIVLHKGKPMISQEGGKQFSEPKRTRVPSHASQGRVDAKSTIAALANYVPPFVAHNGKRQ